MDLVLLDVALQPTIDFGDRLARRGTAVWIRFVVVPGWTDDAENVERVADIVERWQGAVERVEVLPFHTMGEDTWDALGMDHVLRGGQLPGREVVEREREQFRARGLTVH